MKYLLILTLSLPFLFSASAQEWPVPIEDGEVIYQEVVEAPDMTAEKIYKRAVAWANSYYTRFPKKIKNKKEGELLEWRHEFRMDPNSMESSIIKYTAKIQFKEERYRYTIEDLHMPRSSYRYKIEYWMDPQKREQEDAMKDLKTVDTRVKEIINDMKRYIKQPPVEEKDEW